MSSIAESAPTPPVFLSHASEDKERFAIPFAKGLRRNGIDVWLDKWEILPEDSLVDKIFEEGLREATAVVIVLSAVSVTKKWVREELNAAIVSRISKKTRIIPIVLDDCDVPEALKSTVWERVELPGGIDDAVEKITRAIFDISRQAANWTNG